MTKRMSDRHPDEYYRELEARLGALVPLVASSLPPRVLDSYREYLDAGEYGLAVEVAADALAGVPIEEPSRELARALLPEAETMSLESAIDELRTLAESQA